MASKTGRKKIEIDEDQVRQLALMQCTHDEIAAFFNCSTDTIARRFADLITTCRQVGNISLRRVLWKMAVTNENPKVAMWLSEQYLGMKRSSNTSQAHVTIDKANDKLVINFAPDPNATPETK